jgi:hypothetical protein
MGCSCRCKKSVGDEGCIIVDGLHMNFVVNLT